MKCPACFNTLTPITVGSLTVDVCHGGCGGVWFDAFELRKVDEPQESAGEWLVNIERDPGLHVDLTRKRECPRCEGIKLKRHYFSARKNVEVDQCPGCGGYWLDTGELEKIRREMGDAAQRREMAAVRIDGAVVRYLYRMQTSIRDW